MTEYEKLKIICKNIWYTYNPYDYITVPFQWDFDYSTWGNSDNTIDVLKDVRSIIFTKEFIQQYIKYIPYNNLSMFCDLLFWHLDNPVDYLYSLIIKLWKDT